MYEYRSKPRDEVAEMLECYITENQLSPDERLPSERELCDMWGYSRSTMRAAIGKLVVDNKLYSKLGSGTFVSYPRLERNLQDMEPMESVAQKAGKTLTSKVISMEIIESNKQISKKLKVPLGHKIFLLTRLRLVNDVPTLIEIAHINYERCVGIEQNDFSVQSLYKVLLKNYNIKIIGGEETISITYTTENESKWLNVPQSTAVFFLSGVSNDESGEPLEYFKSVVRSDQIRFSSVLMR